MKLEKYSYRNATSKIDSDILGKVEKSLHRIKFDFKSGSSSKLRKQILEELAKHGWSDKVVIGEKTNISITSVNDKCGLCLQTGNMSRFYADILKLEYLFKKNKIKAAIYILPVKDVALLLGSNIAHFERFTRELQIFKDIVLVPLEIYGLKNE